MGRISNIIAGVLCAATAIALPGDLVVLSDKEVRPDEAAGLYYLGSCEAGYLYNGSSAAVGRVAPHRILDRDAETKDYYIVWAPEWVGVTPEAFAHLGTSVRLSEYEVLVSLERGLGPGDLRAVEHRIELIKLEPVTPVDWSYDGEAPPARKSRAIEAAINSITAAEYAGYIRDLQDFETRVTDTRGFDNSRDYLREFFAAQGLAPSLFSFEFKIEFKNSFYRGEPGKIYVATNYATFKRTSDGGATWDTINGKGTNWISSSFWFDDSVGFIAGKSNRIAKTTDGGENWETYDFGSAQPYTYMPEDICFVNPNVGWLCGATKHLVKGFILKSTDGGRSWVEQPTPQDRPLVIRFFDSNHGWVSDGSKVHYTRDGGLTWEFCNTPAGVVDLVAIGPNRAWAAGYWNNLLRTADGLNWTFVDPGVSGFFGRIEFPDAEHGYAAGTKLIATDDGGVNWREVTGAPVIPFYDLMSFADKDRGIIGDYAAKHLYRTDDGGVSFVSIIENVDFEAENVIGERRGDVAPDEIVIIGGHFDSATDNHPCPSPGAEDNASGTACAMAAARALKSLPFERTVRYIAFGGEEDGLLGSKAYADYCASKGEIIIAVLNADMVCYDEDFGTRDDFSVGRGNYKWLFDYLEGVGGLYSNRLIYDDSGGVSDDQSFRNVGYAAMGVIEGGKGPGGFSEYPYYHTTEDTLDKLHPALGVRFVRDYAAMLAHLAGISDVGVKDPRPGAAVPFSRPFAVYPNPYCYATTTGGVNFIGIKTPATVELYDLAGRRVASAAVASPSDEFVWRPGGEALSPGVYLYRVEGREQEESGKIVISR